MKLIQHKGSLYLIDDLMTRMAKDLPAGTLVFCISEFFSGHPEIRLSSGNDNCFGCQPLVACTHTIPSFNVSPEVQAKYELLPDLEAPFYLRPEDWDCPTYSLEDIERAYKAGERGNEGRTLEDHLLFLSALKNIWGCEGELSDDGKCYMVTCLNKLDIDENGYLKAKLA